MNVTKLLPGQTHPELLEGELYLCCLFRDEDYNSLPHTTKRKGKLAYDYLGNHMPGCYPVFVSKAEEEALASARLSQLQSMRIKDISE